MEIYKGPNTIDNLLPSIIGQKGFGKPAAK